jgi:hypothetical protein
MPKAKNAKKNWEPFLGSAVLAGAVTLFKTNKNTAIGFFYFTFFIV